MTSSMAAKGLWPVRRETSHNMASGGRSRLVKTILVVAARPCRRRQTACLVVAQRGGIVAVPCQAVGERSRIEYRLAGAVRAARYHRMGGITEQRHASEAP